MSVNYSIMFNSIHCVFPSSSLNLSANEAAANALQVAGKVAELGVGLTCVVENDACAVMSFVKAVTDLSTLAQQLVTQIDFDLRVARQLHDNLYISWCPDYSNPQPTEDNHKPASTVYPWTLWPLWGGWPNDARNGNVHMPANSDANSGSITLSGMPNVSVPGIPAGAVCLWDYDDISEDDLIYAIDITKVGSFQQLLYNGKQDSWYALDYVVSEIPVS